MNLKGFSSFGRILLLCLTSFALISSEDCTEGCWIIGGEVYDSVNGDLVSGATIELDDEEILSNTNGSFQFQNVSSGIHVLRSSHSDYYSFERTFDISSDLYSNAFSMPLIPIVENKYKVYSIILGWNSPPNDLDLHIYTPWGCVVNFENKVCENETTKVTLVRYPKIFVYFQR